jgi:hypothetical protein
MYVMSILIINCISEWFVVNVGHFNLKFNFFLLIQDCKWILSAKHASHTSMQSQGIIIIIIIIFIFIYLFIFFLVPLHL